MYEVYYLGERIGCTSNRPEKGEAIMFPNVDEVFVISEINEEEKVIFVILLSSYFERMEEKNERLSLEVVWNNL